MENWISVDDRLPDMEAVVMLTLHCDSWKEPLCINLGGRTDGGDGWYWCNSEKYFTVDELDNEDPIEVDVTHWMPLPDPAPVQTRRGHCQCDACRDGTIHASDCSVHNAPAYPKGPCDCVPEKPTTDGKDMEKHVTTAEKGPTENG